MLVSMYDFCKSSLHVVITTFTVRMNVRVLDNGERRILRVNPIVENMSYDVKVHGNAYI